MILKPQIVVSGGYRGSNDLVCEVIPSRGYYEWKNEARGKQPYYFARADGEPEQRNLDALQVSWRRSAFLPGVASEKGKAQTGADLLRAGQRKLSTCSRLKCEIRT
jgi:hypothetical protein